MTTVHPAPLVGALGGVAGLAAVALVVPLSPAGWLVGLAVLWASASLVAGGLRRRRMRRFGPANAITCVRAGLTALVAALAATSLTQPVPPALVVALAAPALVLDGIDGRVARRTGSVSELGARYDMEVDAFLLLVLGLLAGPVAGWWALAIGGMRYAFVAAGRVAPWLRATLPPRYWRKVVTAANGVALTAAASAALPRPLAVALVAIALALLTESFGRDVLWLARRRSATVPTHAWIRPQHENAAGTALTSLRAGAGEEAAP
ncbi:MAG: CDP-alcohol phosphatidyltransferase family protein [Amnibacterium sp.]